MKKFYILLITIFTINIANAQWTKVGLDSNIIYTLADKDSVIFAGTNNGVYLSSNNGANWISDGLDSLHIYNLTINNSNIFAGTNTGLFLTLNNGTSWTKLFNGNINAIACDSSVIFIAIIDSSFSFINLFLSTDNGTNWNILNIIDSNNYINNLFGSINSIVINNYDSLIVSTNGGIYSITKTGLNWYISIVSVNNSFGANLVFTSIVKCGNKLYVGAIGDGGVFRSFDDGLDWTEITSDIGDNYVYSVVTDGTNIFAGTKTGVYFTINNGVHWNNMSTGLTLPIYSLLIYNNYLFAGTLNNGVWRRPLSDFVGIKEHTLNNNVSIYPNPTKEILTIETNLNTEQRLEILNLIGQTVYTIYINKKAIINTSAFANGVYILKIYSDKETIVKKFIKE